MNLSLYCQIRYKKKGKLVKEFTGRDSELNFLEQYYRRPGSQLVVVYGSKGVGKTRLLKEFCPTSADATATLSPS